MSGDQGSSGKDPSAYSTDPNASNSATSGYRVVIAPGTLDSSITAYQKSLSTQPPGVVAKTLHDSVMGKTRFGDIPSAGHIETEMRDFITRHMNAMQSMGIVLDDFVARVQAAAQMGRTGDEVTRAVAAVALALGEL